MRACLDTSAIIKFKKDPTLLKGIKAEELFTTTITKYELLVGALFYGKREKTFVDKIISTLKIVSVEESIELAAEISAKLMKRGEKVNDFDILIAATCINNNLILITSDRDFNKIKEVAKLKVRFV